MKSGQLIAFGLGGLLGAAFGWLVARFYLGQRRVDRVWAISRYPKLSTALR